MLRERFSRPLDPRALRLSASTQEDRVLLPYDLLGSVAHARMLGATGIVPADAARRIERGLTEIARDAARGRLALRAELEDVHLNVEAELTRRIGEDGARLHTARSRNDQVAVDLALYLRERLGGLALQVAEVAGALLSRARSPDGRGVVEAWTHLQPAQSVYWAQLLGSHALRLVRDAERLQAVARGVADSPLGAGAIAGSSLPIDRRHTSRLLGFRRPSPSSIDAVGDRDSVLEALFALALFGVHCSQLAEELVIGAHPRLGRVELSDAFVTTSSLMPHKRNPDLAELVRAESAPALGRLVAALTVLKGLASGYQRDLQLTKPLLFEGIQRASLVAGVLAPMLATARFSAAPGDQPSPTAYVEIADALVAEGVAFRTAHARVAAWAGALARRGRGLEAVGPEEVAAAFPELARRRFTVPRRRDEPELRQSVGGSSWSQVDRLLREVDSRIAAVQRAARRSAGAYRRLHRRLGIPEALFRDGGLRPRPTPPGSPRAPRRVRGGARAPSGARRSVRGP